MQKHEFSIHSSFHYVLHRAANEPTFSWTTWVWFVNAL